VRGRNYPRGKGEETFSISFQCSLKMSSTGLETRILSVGQPGSGGGGKEVREEQLVSFTGRILAKNFNAKLLNCISNFKADLRLDVFETGGGGG
jgi:hypothetical protein